MRIMLIFPPGTIFREEDAPRVFPLGMGYLSAVLERNGYTVKPLDAMSSGGGLIKNQDRTLHVGMAWEEIRQQIEDFCPDVVGISCLWTADYPNAVKTSRIVKQLGDIPVIFGGAHTTALPENVLGNETVDYVVLGEGEISLVQLLKNIGNYNKLSKIPGIGFKIRGKPVINQNREYIVDLDSLPFPARHLFPMENYLSSSYVHNYIFKRQPNFQMITSRGCPLNCAFCTIHSIWGKKMRFRSPRNVVDEIELLVERYGAREIHFEDDNISINRKRMWEICEKIIESRLDICWTAPNGMYAHSLDVDLLKIMKKSGCYRVSIGIENGNQEFLKTVCKKNLNLNNIIDVVKILKKLEIESTGFFMLGIPGETQKTMKETVDFAKRLDLDYSIFSIYSPYPGTELYDLSVRKGYIDPSVNYAKFKNKYSTINTEFLSAKEVEKYRNSALMQLEINKLLNHPIKYIITRQNYSVIKRYAKRIILKNK